MVTRKVASDPRSALTEADVAAQSAIVSALRARWPTVKIVGEEDENDDAAPMSPKRGAPLREDLCAAIETCDDARLRTLRVKSEDVTVFIDPVDGTREFVESRLRAVQCLIGIAVRGRAVAGAIGSAVSWTVTSRRRRRAWCTARWRRGRSGAPWARTASAAPLSRYDSTRRTRGCAR